MVEVAPLTVSQLAGAIEGVLRESFPYVTVVGEVGKATLHGNGHFYFDLKDAGAVVPSVMWRGNVAKQARLPEMGESVVVHAEVTTYKMRGTYQLQVFRIEPVGLGTLLQQVEALKAKLLAEGLFDVGLKRALPVLPRKVGIITSATGAVIADMVQRIRVRCPVPIVLWPATVQGPTAVGEVVRAVEGFNRLEGDARPDVLIVARGGGSMEDLMPFNDEALVRAVAASGIPVVSAIGHEPDVTLCDFAADVRAATPTHAAELVVPVRAEVLEGLLGIQSRLRVDMLDVVDSWKERLTYLQRMLPDPVRLLGQAAQRLDEASLRVVRMGPEIVRLRREKLMGLERVLLAHRPLAPLERGFALVRDAAGKVVRTKDAAAGEVMVEFKDGTRKGTLA